MPSEIVDYEALARSFNQSLISTLRKHAVSQSFLDLWVPDSDPVKGIAAMVDSARLAGRAAIAIRFGIASIPETRLDELRSIIGRCGDVRIATDGTSRILHVERMTGDARGDDAGAAQGRRGASARYWEPSRLEKGAPAPRGTDPVGVHPRLRDALARAARAVTREGVPAQIPGARIVRATEAGVTLFLAVDAGRIVVRAEHTGAPDAAARGALDLFCRSAEGLPFQEVADHVGLIVIERLAAESDAPVVVGILLPHNAGDAFGWGPRLARAAFEAERAASGEQRATNFHYAPPAAQWLALDAVARRDAVERGVRGFLQSEALAPDDMLLLRLENNKLGYPVRCVVGFGDAVAIDAKPGLMRRLEARMRRDVEPTLDFVADRVKDSSPLRRLSG